MKSSNENKIINFQNRSVTLAVGVTMGIFFCTSLYVNSIGLSAFWRQLDDTLVPLMRFIN